jgi:hypothetical protein
MFRLKNISVNGDGTSTIKFNGLNDYIEMDNLNKLPSDDVEEMQVRYEANIIEEGGEEDE